MPVAKPVQQIQQTGLRKGLVQKIHGALPDQVDRPLQGQVVTREHHRHLPLRALFQDFLRRAVRQVRLADHGQHAAALQQRRQFPADVQVPDQPAVSLEQNGERVAHGVEQRINAESSGEEDGRVRITYTPANGTESPEDDTEKNNNEVPEDENQ